MPRSRAVRMVVKAGPSREIVVVVPHHIWYFFKFYLSALSQWSTEGSVVAKNIRHSLFILNDDYQAPTQAILS